MEPTNPSYKSRCNSISSLFWQINIFTIISIFLLRKERLTPPWCFSCENYVHNLTVLYSPFYIFYSICSIFKCIISNFNYKIFVFRSNNKLTKELNLTANFYKSKCFYGKWYIPSRNILALTRKYKNRRSTLKIRCNDKLSYNTIPW